MKICLFSTTHFDGNFFAVLGRGLVAEGMELLLVSLQASRPPVWLAELAGAKHLSLNANTRAQYPLAILKLAQLLRREKVTILHTHLFDAGVVGIVAGRLARMPLTVITRHHIDEPLILGGRLPVEVDRWMARRADCVIVPADAVRRHMVTQESLSDKHVEIVPYGYDFNSFKANPDDAGNVRREFNLESAFVIGCVGRFFKNKGHYYLLKALKEIAREAPNVRLLLLGDGDRALIEEGMREFNVAGQVIFAGYRQDVSACMSAMDLLVHPSLSECLPQVLIEGMNARTTIIATSVGGSPEIVAHGESGLLIPAKDSDAIVDAVLTLYRDAPLRRQLAEAGQRSVREKFTAERMVSRHIEVYRQYLGKELEGGAYVSAEV